MFDTFLNYIASLFLKSGEGGLLLSFLFCFLLVRPLLEFLYSKP